MVGVANVRFGLLHGFRRCLAFDDRFEVADSALEQALGLQCTRALVQRTALLTGRGSSHQIGARQHTIGVVVRALQSVCITPQHSGQNM